MIGQKEIHFAGFLTIEVLSLLNKIQKNVNSDFVIVTISYGITVSYHLGLSTSLNNLLVYWNLNLNFTKQKFDAPSTRKFVDYRVHLNFGM